MAGLIRFLDAANGSALFAGEATFSGFDGNDGWIEVNSVGETITRAIETGRVGTARFRSGCVLEDVEFEKEMDSSSVHLMKLCSAGVVVPQVELVFLSSTQVAGTGDDDMQYTEYFQLTAKECIVTSYGFSGSGMDDGAIPTETIQVNFNKVTWQYWPYEHNTGKKKGALMTGWDAAKQTPYAGG